MKESSISKSKADKLHDKKRREKRKNIECSRCNETSCNCDAGERL